MFAATSCPADTDPPEQNSAERRLKCPSGDLHSHLNGGGIAQLVERQLCKLDVRGSNPLASSDIAGGAAAACCQIYARPVRAFLYGLRVQSSSHLRRRTCTAIAAIASSGTNAAIL